jgi:hypothetical protein
MISYVIMSVDDIHSCQNNSMNSKRNYSNSPKGEIKQGTIRKYPTIQFTNTSSKSSQKMKVELFKFPQEGNSRA